MQPNPEDFVKLAYSTAIKFSKKNPSLWNIEEELKSESLLGMVEACAAFDSKRAGKMKAVTFIVHRCQQQMLNFITRNEFKYGVICKLEDLSCDNEETEVTWEDIIQGDVVDLQTMMKRLPDGVREDAETFSLGLNDHKTRKIIGCNWPVFREKKEIVKEAIKNLHMN